MRQIVYSILIIVFLFFGKIAFAIPNPWIDCGDDMYCAAKQAGFNFPLRVQNYSVRAMNDMIEITFPLDKNRAVTIRKSENPSKIADKNGIKDISGDYNKYPVNKIIWINQSVPFSVRGDRNKFYIVNFVAETGYYSFSCKDGLKLNDIKYLYKLLKEAEAPRNNEEAEIYTIEQLMKLRRVDGIVEPVYTQDCFPRTLQKKGVTKNCFERTNLGQDIFCSLSEIKMIRKYYKSGQDKDPLNNSEGYFCAE